MSQIVADFNPATKTSGTFSPQFPNGQGRLVVWNKSNIDLLFSWPATAGVFIPAWQARLLYVQSGNAQISWNQLLVLPGQTPDSTVIVESYADSEQIPETFPAPLNRAMAQANTIVPNPNATFFFAANQKGTGPVKIQILPFGDGATLSYLTGFTFTTQYNGGAVSQVSVTVQGLAENFVGDTPIYYGTINANGGAWIDVRFPNPIPASSPQTTILLQSSSYPAGVNGCLIAFGYQQIPTN